MSSVRHMCQERSILAKNIAAADDDHEPSVK
jgi:hypothetical protein